MTFTSTYSVAYEIEYFKNLDGVNSLYLVFNDVDAYFECIDKNKYLVFDLTDKNREAYIELQRTLGIKIERIKGIEPIKYEKDIMNIIFESDYRLPLDKILNIPLCVITVKSVFEENDKYYPQVYLEDCFLSMNMKTEIILILFVKTL